MATNQGARNQSAPETPEKVLADRTEPDEVERFFPAKTWLSFEAQLNLIESRGMVIEDRARAHSYLETYGYYRLSGYWYPLREIDASASSQQDKAVRKEKFVDGSRFGAVIELHEFDCKLRALCLRALERIEMAVRVDVAYALGRHSPHAHELSVHLDGKFTKEQSDKEGSRHDAWLASYEKSVKMRNDSHPLVAHYLGKYGGLPIWVAIEIFEFGMLSKLLSGMRHEDLKPIADKYGAKTPKQLKNWLHSLTFLRNAAAHHSRLWNANFTNAASRPKGWPEINPHRCFAFLCLLKHLLAIIDPQSGWASKVEELLENDFPGVSQRRFALEGMGISDVTTWKETSPWNPASKK